MENKMFSTNLPGYYLVRDADLFFIVRYFYDDYEWG